MKRFRIAFFCLVALSIFACSDDEAKVEETVSEDLVGKWELQEIHITGTIDFDGEKGSFDGTAHSMDDKNTIHFKADGTFTAHNEPLEAEVAYLIPDLPKIVARLTIDAQLPENGVWEKTNHNLELTKKNESVVYDITALTVVTLKLEAEEDMIQFPEEFPDEIPTAMEDFNVTMTFKKDE